MLTTWSQFVCPANQHPKSTAKKKKPTNLCVPREFLNNNNNNKISGMFDNCTILLCWLENICSHVLAAWSQFRALITWSRRTTRAKDHRLFNYPQFSEVGKSDHIIYWTSAVIASLPRKIGPRGKWRRQGRRVCSVLLTNVQLTFVLVPSAGSTGFTHLGRNWRRSHWHQGILG